LLLAKTITTITLGGDKIQRLTLNQILIALNRHENPTQYSQQGMSGSGPGLFSFFLFLFILLSTSRRQSINQNQTL
jgi:hypothetical protein